MYVGSASETTLYGPAGEENNEYGRGSECILENVHCPAAIGQVATNSLEETDARQELFHETAETVINFGGKHRTSRTYAYNVCTLLEQVLYNVWPAEAENSRIDTSMHTTRTIRSITYRTSTSTSRTCNKLTKWLARSCWL